MTTGTRQQTEPARQTPAGLLRIQEELIGLEPLFHRPEHGTTRGTFEAMTDEEFWETGASGRRYSREFVIDTVLKRYADAYEDRWETEDFHCQEIASDLYLLTYTLYQEARVTRRATLWRRQGERWVAIYHQGTVVDNAAADQAV